MAQQPVRLSGPTDPANPTVQTSPGDHHDNGNHAHAVHVDNPGQNLPAGHQPTWEEVLDDYERYLASLLQAVDVDGLDRNSPWTPPDGLDPLPSHLIDRAQALQQQTQAAMGELAGAMMAVRDEITALHRPTPAPRPITTTMLDTTA